jgi:hypothetical protein
MPLAKDDASVCNLGVPTWSSKAKDVSTADQEFILEFE